MPGADAKGFWVGPFHGGARIGCEYRGRSVLWPGRFFLGHRPELDAVSLHAHMRMAHSAATGARPSRREAGEANESGEGHGRPAGGRDARAGWESERDRDGDGTWGPRDGVEPLMRHVVRAGSRTTRRFGGGGRRAAPNGRPSRCSGDIRIAPNG